MSSKCTEKEEVSLRKRPALQSAPAPRRGSPEPSQRPAKQRVLQSLTVERDSADERQPNLDLKRSKEKKGQKNGKRSLSPAGARSKSENSDWLSSKILENVLRKVEKALYVAYEQNCSAEAAQLVDRGSNGSFARSEASAHPVSLRFVSPKERRLVINLPGPREIGHGKNNTSGIDIEDTQFMEHAFSEQPSKLSSQSRDKTDFPTFVDAQVSAIAARIKHNQIVYYCDFIKAINRAVNQTFRKFPKLPYREFFSELERTMTERQEQFRVRRLQDIKELYLYLPELSLQVEQYPRIPLQPRVYNEIATYKSVFDDQEDASLRTAYNAEALMRSDLRGHCAKKCACTEVANQSVAEFSEFVAVKSAWTCECADKRDNVECDESCGCGKNCPNRLLQTRRSQTLGADVKIQLCWGIDMFTRHNIMRLLPDNGEMNVAMKEDIVNEVVRELNRWEQEGWEISLTFASLHERYKEKCKKLRAQSRLIGRGEGGGRSEAEQLVHAREIADARKKGFKTLLKFSRLAAARGLLRVFSKGLGVVCAREGGIPRNSLIVEYFGEVYPTWYWYIKQDAIKNFLTVIKKDKSKKFAQYKQNYNMDFYNIMLEKSQKEPRGREIVVVDPILNGNFASRLSHCCVPNCCTLPIVSRGSYSIALFAAKSIEMGEELTFDYCSFTENEKEFQTSICLCGHSQCNGHYLSYTKKHVGLFDSSIKIHLLDNVSFSFLNANAILLRSAISVFDETKRARLLAYSIGDNTFKASPPWLRNWAYYVLEAIVEEHRALYQHLLGSVPSYDCANMLTYEMQNHKFEIENLFFQRINNLIITIDKAQHFLSRQAPEQQSLPPIRLMAPHEILPHLAENFLAVAEQVFKGRQPETLRLVKDLLEGFVADPKENGKAEPSTPKFFANEDSNSSNPSKSTRLTKSGEPKADLKAAFLAKFKLLIKVWNKEGPLLTATPAADATLTNRIASLSNSLALTQLKCCKYLYLKLAESVKANLSNSMYLPLSDILYFIAMTLNNFTSELYSNFEVSVKIRECDLINPRKAFERNQLPYEEQIKHLEKPIEVVKK